MEKLRRHFIYCADNCYKTTINKEIWLHQAFGALQYHITLFPEDFEVLEKEWNEKWKPFFEREIYGNAFRFRR